MAKHQASEQMLGYLYQVRYALALLLDNDSPDFQISIEKFDDVAFSKDGIPKQLIQLKHHIQRCGNLTNSSTDLWRTLKVWIDVISKDPDMLSETEFLIITTAISPDGTVASCLKKNEERNVEDVYRTLMAVCVNSENKEHKIYYEAFLKTNATIIKHLLSRICVIDGASDIIDTERVIRKHIRYSCVPKYENQICERLEGWWYQKAIEALSSDTPIFVTQCQVRSFIVSVSQEYADDDLPIDIFDISNLQEIDFSNSEKIFYEQLKLIHIGSQHMRIALRDYYRAFSQRANWVRNDLLYLNELGEYEQRLIDEWEHCFVAMEDDLIVDKEATEEEKINEGRRLFLDIEKKDIRIRPKCREAFVMRGSYHILSNQLKIGWHIDFYNRLKNLLNT